MLTLVQIEVAGEVMGKVMEVMDMVGEAMDKVGEVIDKVVELFRSGN